MAVTRGDAHPAVRCVRATTVRGNSHPVIKVVTVMNETLSLTAPPAPPAAATTAVS